MKNNSTIIRIMAKAKSSIHHLTKTLHEGMLGEDWAPSKVTFTLFTTKKLSEEALALLGQGFSVSDLQVECFLSTQEATLALFKDHHRWLAGPLINGQSCSVQCALLVPFLLHLLSEQDESRAFAKRNPTSAVCETKARTPRSRHHRHWANGALPAKASIRLGIARSAGSSCERVVVSALR
jgi:hypothetical protein